MALDKNNKNVYVREPYGSFIYKWSPQTHSDDTVGVGKNNEFCNAVAYSQGKDLIVTYMRKSDHSGDAYVACDYVK